MLNNKLKEFNIILASKSPRRQFLLKEIGVDFEIRTKETDESFPPHLQGPDIALFLSRKKAEAFAGELAPGELLITADTIVWTGSEVLNKPADFADAVKILSILSGRMHTVYTGVCIGCLSPFGGGKGEVTLSSFVTSTNVHFRKLSLQEIESYITHYSPFDKAGAYGAQECLPAGMNPCSQEEKEFMNKINNPNLFEKSNATKAGIGEIGIIEKISGSYFNVMGLPVKELYEELEKM
jgi:septum formation protein